MKGKLFVVSAPSGAGKTSLITALLYKVKGRSPLKRVVTYTTKPPRPGDVDGQDYHFVSKKEFKKKVQEGFFLEYSTAYGHYYGSPRSLLNELDTGISYIAILDKYGAKMVHEAYQEAVLIWIQTSSIEVLKKRLILRGHDSQKQMALRLSLAQQEMDEELAQKFYHFHVDNDEFSRALQKIEEIIFSKLQQAP